MHLSIDASAAGTEHGAAPFAWPRKRRGATDPLVSGCADADFGFACGSRPRRFLRGEKRPRTGRAAAAERGRFAPGESHARSARTLSDPLRRRLRAADRRAPVGRLGRDDRRPAHPRLHHGSDLLDRRTARAAARSSRLSFKATATSRRTGALGSARRPSAAGSSRPHIGPHAVRRPGESTPYRAMAPRIP
jgi:hypothetical protein